MPNNQQLSNNIPSQIPQQALKIPNRKKRLIQISSILIILLILLGSIIFYYFYKPANTHTNIQTTDSNTQPEQITSVTSPTKPSIKHWLISENAADGLLTTPGGANFINAINTPNTYEIVHGKKTDPLPNATHVLSFPSYQKIQDAFTNNQIPANIKVILYDNEIWPETPVNEQQQPFTYVPLAENVVHSHGLLFMNAPAADLKRALDPAASNNYAGYLQMKLATLAKYTDIFEIQAQNNPTVTEYVSFSQQALAQARGANSNAILLLGITAKTTGPTSQELIQEIQQTKNITDGYWFNIIGDEKNNLSSGINIALPVIQALSSI
ncbi:MAG TPA: hypothetical protein VF810_05130 [Patescibacteria group bacterium]